MPWIQLTIDSDPAGAPRITELLEELGADAVTLLDAGDQPLYEPPVAQTPLWQATRVTALFPAETDIEAVARGLGERLAPAPMPPWRAEPLEERDWGRAWMENFRPLRCGDRLWIVPSWHAPPQPDAVNVLLDPGLAFGTGSHPTTRLCLEWLDAHPPEGRTVIDYGCGSGILAVAAAHLGAARVIGVDNDPQALLATEENARRNGVAVEVFAPERLPAGRVDVLVANILANPLIELAPRLAQLVRDSGLIALSGILPEQAAGVAEAYAGAFDLLPAVELEGWVRIEGRRRPG